MTWDRPRRFSRRSRQNQGASVEKIGRDDWIGTSDALTPSQGTYQAALPPVTCSDYRLRPLAAFFTLFAFVFVTGAAFRTDVFAAVAGARSVNVSTAPPADRTPRIHCNP